MTSVPVTGCTPPTLPKSAFPLRLKPLPGADRLSFALGFLERTFLPLEPSSDFTSSNPGSGEDHGLVGVGEDAMAKVPLHSAREHDPLQIPALLNQTRKLVVLRDARDILLDDWAFVQLLGHIMAGSSDQLYAACK